MRDRGSASLMLLAIGLVIVAAAVAGAAIGTARVARHEAKAAADLGALAGAMRAIEGEPVACAEASRLVRANGATMTRCDVQGLEIVVYAEVPTATRRATAGARAGPIYPIAASTVSRTRTAPGLSSGLFPLPHFGDWTQDGRPDAQPHREIAERVAESHSTALAYARSAKPAPPGCPS